MPTPRERQVVQILKSRLQQYYQWVDCHRKPSASPPLRQSIQRQLRYTPILQPEIDICADLGDGLMAAAEVKVFLSEELGDRLPYYEGIGQALALHRYGFDFAALWQVFIGDFDQNLMTQYGSQAWFLVRNELKLPLDFTYFWLKEIEPAATLHVYQYSSDRTGHFLTSFDPDHFCLKWRHSNPLRHKQPASIVRPLLESWLKKQ